MEKIIKIKDDGIKKDQILSEGNFLHYCNDANNRVVTMTGKIHKWIEEDFLRAMESDGFLKPLLVVEQPVRQNDGSVKEQSIRYYSPFQIYIVLQLSHNIIDKEGRLQSPSSIEWQSQQKTRFISWGSGGGMSFNLELQARAEKDASGRPTQLALCHYLHDFLLMLHSFDIAERSSTAPDEYAKHIDFFSQYCEKWEK